MVTPLMFSFPQCGILSCGCFELKNQNLHYQDLKMPLFQACPDQKLRQSRSETFQIRVVHCTSYCSSFVHLQSFENLLGIIPVNPDLYLKGFSPGSCPSFYVLIYDAKQIDPHHLLPLHYCFQRSTHCTHSPHKTHGSSAFRNVEASDACRSKQPWSNLTASFHLIKSRPRKSVCVQAMHGHLDWKPFQGGV